MRLDVRNFRQLISACAAAPLLLAGLLPLPAYAQATSASQTAGPGPAWRWSASDVTRLESWSFFEPPPTGGNPDYAFIANRLRAGLTYAWRQLEFSGTVQYVQFGGLPDDAIGPGPLGTGALYYEHSGDTESHGVFVRTLNVRARLRHGRHDRDDRGMNDHQ